MRDIKLKLTFTQRQNVLAARKPFESFGATLNRLMTELLDTVPAHTNVKYRLCPIKKRWRIPTEEGNRERAFELYVEGIRSAGFKDSLESLREDFEDSLEDQEPKDPREWQHECDVDVEVVCDLVLAELRTRSKGSKFDLYQLIDKACPRIHRIPMSKGNAILARLLESQQFMRSVRHISGSGYHNTKLQKL